MLGDNNFSIQYIGALINSILRKQKSLFYEFCFMTHSFETVFIYTLLKESPFFIIIYLIIHIYVGSFTSFTK